MNVRRNRGVGQASREPMQETSISEDDCLALASQSLIIFQNFATLRRIARAQPVSGLPKHGLDAQPRKRRVVPRYELEVPSLPPEND